MANSQRSKDAKTQMDWERENKKKKADAEATKKLTNPQDELTTGKAPTADFPLIQRENGNITGVDLPNGDSFRGLDPDAVQKIVDNWNNSNAEPANSMYADVYKAKQDEMAAAQAIAGDKAALTQNGALLGESVGTTDPAIVNNPNDPLSQDINRLQTTRQGLAEIQGMTGLPLSGISQFSGTIRNILNSEFLGGKLGTDLVNTISYNSPGIKEYLNNYSNKENFDTLDQDISNSQSLLTQAVNAANRATSVEEQMNAYLLYRKALSRLVLAQTQLKQIGDRDKTAYTDDVKLREADLNAYMDGINTMNDRMRIALQSPNPMSIQQPTGGIPNGG